MRLVPTDTESEIGIDTSREALKGLLVDMQAGDDAALKALYEATAAKVYALALHILSNSADAEEITEDVYLYAWRNAHRYDPSRGSVNAWLLTIARSRAIDRVRYRQKHKKLGEALAREPESADLTGLELNLFDGGRLNKFLDQLPEVQRQILTLAYFRGLTHHEISSSLSMSLGTVKTHIRRTLVTLREAMQV